MSVRSELSLPQCQNRVTVYWTMDEISGKTILLGFGRLFFALHRSKRNNISSSTDESSSKGKKRNIPLTSDDELTTENQEVSSQYWILHCLSYEQNLSGNRKYMRKYNSTCFGCGSTGAGQRRQGPFSNRDFCNK